MATYARVLKARNDTDWVVSTNTSTLGTMATFAEMAGGAGGTVTFFGVGYDAIGGANGLAFFGTVTPNIPVVAGVTPRLDTSTVITQAVSDAMTTAAANLFLLLFFNNTAWAVVGDASGLQPSGAAGSVYLSLHTASPGEGGNQSTSEIAYT